MNTASLADHVSPYDRFALGDAEVEQMLVGGQHERDLIAYFGELGYQELKTLAQEAHATALPAQAPRVWIVPGIMGTQLGLRRHAPLPDDVLWLDPIDVRHGRLAALRLEPQAADVVPLGVVLDNYLRLKLHLRAAGFDAVFHPYDWRLDVRECGRRLAQKILQDSASTVALVAHSMGGLVARAALSLIDAESREASERIKRVVLLGTPNHGSFAPVQALRGVYAVVRKIARLDLDGTAEQLAAEVFNSFPSLYQMLPTSHCTGLDFLDAAQWPDGAPKLRHDLLENARSTASALASADERFATVVGVGQETVTAVARRDDEFIYTISREGDGTVPAVSAAWIGARSFYTNTPHSELTRDAQVAKAVIDLLRSGSTRSLAPRWRNRAAARACITDTELRCTHVDKVDWVAITADERRHFLQTLNEPPKLKLRVPMMRQILEKA